MRSKPTRELLEKTQVDEVPLFKQKLPLQQAIQLLKRHRDFMFQDDEDAKPISIIITTLATRAYSGESDLLTMLSNLLNNLGKYVNSSSPRVPNPVDREEDFADRWSMPKYQNLKLEQNFWAWLTQAKADFEAILGTEDTALIAEKAMQRFALNLDRSDLAKSLVGITTTTEKKKGPTVHVISERETAKPWSLKS